MVETRLILEPEVQQILACIDSKRNFLLSGGAGSGKTYSLVQVIRQLIDENPTAKVACMTYTNAAVKEIEGRVNHKNLNVTTLHDFLWDNIKHFQGELKSGLITLINDEAVTKIKVDGILEVPNDYFANIEEGIQYKDYLKLKEGIISHDQLLILSDYLFANYPKLCDIVKDRFKYILIDEYQDTNKAVIKVFLVHFRQTAKRNVIGFFGDAMQSIYDDTISNLNDYKGDQEDQVKEIKKEQNRRNPLKIIELANRIRTDGLTQVPSTDLNAPNMVNGVCKDGDIKFLYSTNPDIQRVREFLVGNYGWNFSDLSETKELNLTHELIADKAGFRTLMDIYNGDKILTFRDRIKAHIKEKNITTDFSTSTFGEVITALQQGKTGRDLKAVSPTAGMEAFINQNGQLYATALSYNYLEFSRLYVDKDQLIDDKKQEESEDSKKGSKRDNLIKHLYKLQNNIALYENRKFNEFLRKTDFIDKLINIESKRNLKINIEELINVGEKTIEEVINSAHVKGICIINESVQNFQIQNSYIYNRVKEVHFSEFQKLYDYLEGKTPFSTQHKTKGAEFSNVFLILDNGNWNNYNFQNLFLNNGTPTVLERSQKIFYVCCTRAKDNLAVFFHSPDDNVKTKAREWFGSVNVIDLDT